MRNKQLLMRVIATAVAAFAVVLAANFAGFDWYKKFEQQLQSPPPSTPSKPLPRTGPVGLPVSVTPMRPEGNDSSMSEVPLPLILVRSQRGSNSRQGFAQIGVHAQTPQTYSAGAVLANGARLSEIYDHYVVLERDGQTARLYVQGEAQQDAGAPRSLVTVSRTAQTVSANVASRDDLTDYLRLSPVFHGDQLHGYALYAGRNPTVFSQWGLQPGDVLTGINGTAVSNSRDSMTVLHTLTEGEVLAADIEREGTPQFLSLDGSILKQAAAEEKVTSAGALPTGAALAPIALRSFTKEGNGL